MVIFEFLQYFTQPTNLAGLPAISIPFGLSSKKLPIGLQLISGLSRDAELLKIAFWLQKRFQFIGLDVNKDVLPYILDENQKNPN